jgi:hypothetical protein
MARSMTVAEQQEWLQSLLRASICSAPCPPSAAARCRELDATDLPAPKRDGHVEFTTRTSN